MKTAYFLALISAQLLSYLAQSLDAPETNFSKPLFLTPLIKGGQHEKAKQLSSVEPFPGFNYTSYSGFITIDDKLQSNTFFWYFTSKNNSYLAPVLLWMTGGPGISALSALFGETGPFYPDTNLTLKSREFNWISDYNVIYVDIPVGAGFSFTNSTSGYAKNTSQMASQVVKFLDQFFQLFSEFKKNDFYIVGKSYSGKVAMALATQLLLNNGGGQPTMNLKGVVTICGFHDPVYMSVASDHYYHLGLIDENQKKHVVEQEAFMVASYEKGSIGQANMAFYDLNATLTNMTKMFEISNFMFTILPSVFTDYERFIEQSYVRRKIHVGDLPFNGPDNVNRTHLDHVASSKPDLQYILNNSDLKVLLISGQLDLIVAPHVQRQFVTNLIWPGSALYNASQRVVYRIHPNDSEIAGYVKQADRLTEVMLRSGGHMLPHDQPRATLDVLNRFIRNEKFS